MNLSHTKLLLTLKSRATVNVDSMIQQHRVWTRERFWIKWQIDLTLTFRLNRLIIQAKESGKISERIEHILAVSPSDEVEWMAKKDKMRFLCMATERQQCCGHLQGKMMKNAFRVFGELWRGFMPYVSATNANFLRFFTYRLPKLLSVLPNHSITEL